jgi:hypothetical protein
MYDFYSEFSSALGDGDVSGANAALMKELAAILVRDKSDFVDMLNESGVIADIDMSDAELIQLFVDNASTNKKLILGASLLVNLHNKKMGFDGEDEISDEAVKQSYFTMKSCFVDAPSDDEDFSYFPIGLTISAGSKIIGKGLDAVKERGAAKDKMREEARKRREEARRRAEEERKRKQKNMLIYGGVAIVGILVIGIILIRRK